MASFDVEHRLRARRASIVAAPWSLGAARWLCCPEACGIVPRPEMKPMSSALTGRVSTAGPPGKFFFFLLLALYPCFSKIHQPVGARERAHGRQSFWSMYVHPSRQSSSVWGGFPGDASGEEPACQCRWPKWLSMHAHYVCDSVLLSPCWWFGWDWYSRLGLISCHLRRHFSIIF